MEADIIRDFENRLEAITLRPFDDGRFVVKVDGKVIYDKDRTGKFPNYAQDIKPKLEQG